MAAAKRRLTLDVIKQALASTTRLSAFVLFILIGARVFSLTFYGVNGHLWVEHLLVSLPGGEIGFLIVVNVLVFLLAFFLDFFELAFIIVPLLAPAADKLGIDLIWFGVLLGVNMQTSFMHPPFGFALFYLRSVAPRVPYLDRVTGKHDRADHHRPDLLGRRALRGDPGASWSALVIAFPQMVMHYKGKVVDPGDVKIVLPPMGGGQQPGLGCRVLVADLAAKAGSAARRRSAMRPRRKRRHAARRSGPAARQRPLPAAELQLRLGDDWRGSSDGAAAHSPPKHEKAPAHAPGPFASVVPDGSELAVALLDHHERVVVVFGHLRPQEVILAEAP